MTFSGQLHSFITQLSGRINRLEEYALEAGLQEPLSSAEIRIIQAVGLDGSGKMSHISASLSITLATLTVSCDKLEARGFLTKTRDVSDKRTVRIGLTEKGIIAYRFHASFVESLISLFLRDFTEDERAVLRKIMANMNSMLEDMTKETI